MNNGVALVLALYISASMASINLTDSMGSPSPSATGPFLSVTDVTQAVTITAPHTLNSLATASVESNKSTSTVAMPTSNVTVSVTTTGVTSSGSISVVVTTQASNIATIVATSTVAPNASMPTSNVTSSLTTTNVTSDASISTMVTQNISSSAAASNLFTSMFTSTVVMATINSSSMATPRHNITTSEAASSTVVAQPVNFTVSKAGNSTQTASISMMLNSTSQSTVPFTSTIGVKPSINASTSSPYSSPNSTVPGNGANSLQPTPTLGSAVYSNETSQPSQLVSSIPSSFTSLNMTTESSPSAAVSITPTGVQSTFTLSASGQTSNTSRPPSSEAVMHSSNVSQSAQLDTSMLAQSPSMAMVSVMTQGSLTVSISNSSSTPSPEINATTASSKTTPSTSAAPTPFTLPPEGTRVVKIEVTFEMEYKNEYNNPESKEYKELETNLTTALNNVYRHVDGFVTVRILIITKGSVVCSYIVILNKDSKVEESELKDKLEDAKEDLQEKWGFSVMSVKVTEGDATKTEEKLPDWALAVMIVLGCLSAVCVIAMFYVCVKYRRTLYGSSDAYLVSSGEVGIVNTYDTISIGDNKKRTSQGHGQRSTPERRVIGSHTNPTYNGALGD